MKEEQKLNINNLFLVQYTNKKNSKHNYDLFVRDGCFQYLEVTGFDSYTFLPEGLTRCGKAFRSLDGTKRGGLDRLYEPFREEHCCLNVIIEALIPFQQLCTEIQGIAQTVTKREAYQILHKYLEYKREEEKSLKH